MKPRELINQLSQKVTQEVSSILLEENEKSMEVSKKDDASVVTNIDLTLSALIKEEVSRVFGDELSFYCEEDHGELTFPALVLDPIDGTRGLVTKTYESAVSLAVMESPSLEQGFGYIFNPFTGFHIASDDQVLHCEKKKLKSSFGFVSRSEWEKGLYKNFQSDDISLSPLGSIAFKLGLLATGACDFVVSANSKNIWDIAAGSILCEQRGIHLYDQHGERMVELKEKSIQGPMFWSRPEMKNQLSEMILEQRAERERNKS